ncbi:MAG: hypothetical protein KDK65_05655, partial [Chlamydiia bacterium]|nr:hypothetical protein [Chlamydiia bacterium]
KDKNMNVNPFSTIPKDVLILILKETDTPHKYERTCLLFRDIVENNQNLLDTPERRTALVRKQVRLMLQPGKEKIREAQTAIAAIPSSDDVHSQAAKGFLDNVSIGMDVAYNQLEEEITQLLVANLTLQVMVAIERGQPNPKMERLILVIQGLILQYSTKDTFALVA